MNTDPFMFSVADCFRDGKLNAPFSLCWRQMNKQSKLFHISHFFQSRTCYVSSQWKVPVLSPAARIGFGSDASDFHLVKIIWHFLPSQLDKEAQILKRCDLNVITWYFSFNFLQQTQMKCFWDAFHINGPFHKLPSKMCWLGLGFWCLQQLWKYDGCNLCV